MVFELETLNYFDVRLTFPTIYYSTIKYSTKLTNILKVESYNLARNYLENKKIIDIVHLNKIKVLIQSRLNKIGQTKFWLTNLG